MARDEKTITNTTILILIPKLLYFSLELARGANAVGVTGRVQYQPSEAACSAIQHAAAGGRLQLPAAGCACVA
eukprot:COSAG02_NODE_57926_length_279_cov_0.572222_1_plen_72_part_01